jgi:hypothetical protein
MGETAGEWAPSVVIDLDRTNTDLDLSLSALGTQPQGVTISETTGVTISEIENGGGVARSADVAGGTGGAQSRRTTRTTGCSVALKVYVYDLPSKFNTDVVNVLLTEPLKDWAGYATGPNRTSSVYDYTRYYGTVSCITHTTPYATTYHLVYRSTH